MDQDEFVIKNVTIIGHEGKRQVEVKLLVESNNDIQAFQVLEWINSNMYGTKENNSTEENRGNGQERPERINPYIRQNPGSK